MMELPVCRVLRCIRLRFKKSDKLLLPNPTAQWDDGSTVIAAPLANVRNAANALQTWVKSAKGSAATMPSFPALLASSWSSPKGSAQLANMLNLAGPGL